MSAHQEDFHEAVNRISSKDSRYDKAAYYFIRKALDYSLKKVVKKKSKKDNHVSGQELLEGIRRYGLEQYGPMTFTLLDYWGVKSCKDFGEMVFNLVEEGIFGRREQDSKNDFDGKQDYDFQVAFIYPFLSRKKRKELAETAQQNSIKPE